MPLSKKPDRNLAMELVRVTESAALAASKWVGRGDKNSADGAAVDAMRNLLDTAVLSHVELQRTHGMEAGYAKVDEIPFDFSRRRLSVVVLRPDGRHLLICKGAVEEIFAVCTRYEAGDESGSLDESHFRAAQEQTRALNEDGFRVVAVAYREFDEPRQAYGITDEAGLTLLGYIAFLDPPKESARQALAALAAKGVAVKVVTGDNEVITRKICREVGLEPGEIVTGARVASLDDASMQAIFAERGGDPGRIHRGQCNGNDQRIFHCKDRLRCRCRYLR